MTSAFASQLCSSTRKKRHILAPIESGVFNKEAIAAGLAALCRGRHSGRTDASEITLFKTVGTALEDLAAASLAFDLLTKPPQAA